MADYALRANPPYVIYVIYVIYVVYVIYVIYVIWNRVEDFIAPEP